MFVFIPLAQLTQNTKLKSMSSVFMQAIAATVCSRLPISCLLLIVFSEWRLPLAVCWHSYTGRSQPPACCRALARCAHAPSWTLKCKCRFYVSALHDEAFLHLTTLTSEHKVVLSKRQSAVFRYIASASLELNRKSFTGCDRSCGIPKLYSSRDVRNLGKGMRLYPKIRFCLIKF